VPYTIQTLYQRNSIQYTDITQTDFYPCQTRII